MYFTQMAMGFAISQTGKTAHLARLITPTEQFFYGRMNANVKAEQTGSTHSLSINSASLSREAFSSIINRVAVICGEFEIDSLTPQIKACEQLIAGDETIDVAVLGNFKAGKSSFLNNLMGEDILPVGVLPLTAIITRLRYGKSVNATVQFLDGASRQVPVAEVGNYIAESENPKNAKRVFDVLIETPALKPYAGLQFIDTPGLNSIYAHNSETSRNWLPRVGAALLTISADHPFSEQDAELVKASLRSTPRVNVLLTKADLLDAQQLEEVKNFIHRQMAAITSERIPLYIYSTRNNATSHRNVLDRELLSPLTLGRASESDNILRHKLSILLADALNYVKIGLAAVECDQANRTGLRDQILDRKSNEDAAIEELRLVERDCINKTRSQVEEIIQSHQAPMQHELTVELKSRLLEWKLNLWKLSRTYEAWLGEVLTQKILTVSNTEAGKLALPMENAERRFSRVTGNFKNSLAVNVERCLGIKMSSVAWRGEIKMPTQADISISPAFDIHIDSLWFLLPTPLIKPWVHRHFLRNVPWEVEKNLSRLETQWTNSIDGRIHDLKRQAEDYVQTEIKTIGHLLNGQPSKTSAFVQAREVLGQCQRLLAANFGGSQI